MRYKDLAQELLDQFRMFAFKCECGGKDDSCRQVREDAGFASRDWMLLEIVNYIASKEDLTPQDYSICPNGCADWRTPFQSITSDRNWICGFCGRSDWEKIK